MCSKVGRKCPKNYISPNHSKWSDPEEEDWNGEREKEKESKGNEIEQNNVQKEINQKPMKNPYYPSSPQYKPTCNSDAFTPVLTDKLV